MWIVVNGLFKYICCVYVRFECFFRRVELWVVGWGYYGGFFVFVFVK